MTILTREMIRDYPCPKCKAKPGSPCKRGKQANHAERQMLAQQLYDHKADRQAKRREEAALPPLSASALKAAPPKPQRKLVIQRDEDGTYSVRDTQGTALASGMSNAQAWRRFDILMNEPVNKRQDTGDWAFKQFANGR